MDDAPRHSMSFGSPADCFEVTTAPMQSSTGVLAVLDCNVRTALQTDVHLASLPGHAAVHMWSRA